MNCPFKYQLQAFEGGVGGDPECAWLVEVLEGSAKPVTVCAMVMTGMECTRRPLNVLEEEAGGSDG